jgi:hypothetical protein
MASIAPKNAKNSVTIRNSEGKQLFYVAINPNQEIVQQGIIYNNSNSYMNDNAYPNEIYDTYKNGSAVFSRYISLKKNLIMGNGLQPVDPNNNKLWDWIAQKNAAQQDKDDLLEMIAFDMALYEGAYIQAVMDSNGKPAELYFTDFNKLRAAEKNDLGFSTDYYFSRNWGIVINQRQQAKMSAARNMPEFKIQAWNPNDIRDGRQIIPIMSYAGTSTYPCVSYNAVLPYIKLAYQLGVFELNRALNGFLPSTIVYVVGIQGEDAQRKYVENFETNFVGTSKSKVLFMFGETTDASPKVEKLDGDANSSEGVFEKLIDICNSQITIALSGSMPLSGIDSKGQQLGGDQNLLFMSRENYMANTIVPVQKLILKKLNMITNDMLGLGEMTIVNTPLHITLPKEQPEDMTRTERRDILWGLEPLPQDVEEDGTPSASGETITTGAVSDVNVAATALNGSQITSLLEVINAIGVGSMTAESAKAIIAVAYPMFSSEQIDSIINNLKPAGAPATQVTPIPAK